MIFSMYRIRMRLKKRAVHYVKCGVKTGTFLLCASLYLLVMKLTIFKPETILIQNVATGANDSKWMNSWATEYKEGRAESVLQNITDEQYYALLSEYEARVRRVDDACRRHNLSSGRVNSKEFFVDHDHRLIWCNIFKAASSSWMYNFNILGGYSEKFLSRTHQTPLILARKKFPRPTEEDVLRANADPNSFSFLTVREPFERLLSGYRDKLENFGPLYYRKLARKIVQRYRKQAEQLFGKIKSFGPTFYEFVKYITESYKAMGDNFVFDEHWAPYYKFCSPCVLRFKMVVKVETLQRDNEFIVRELGLTDTLTRRAAEKKTRVKTIMNKSRDGKNTTTLLRKYFSQIDQQMLKDLLDIYKIDFEMFGYDPNVYKKYVSNYVMTCLATGNCLLGLN